MYLGRKGCDQKKKPVQRPWACLGLLGNSKESKAESQCGQAMKGCGEGTAFALRGIYNLVMFSQCPRR